MTQPQTKPAPPLTNNSHTLPTLHRPSQLDETAAHAIANNVLTALRAITTNCRSTK